MVVVSTAGEFTGVVSTIALRTTEHDAVNITRAANKKIFFINIKFKG